jgi:hypothetical protein
MSDTGYKVLGYLVWHGGKLYLRRRLPAGRATALKAAGLFGVLAAAAALARRSAR